MLKDPGHAVAILSPEARLGILLQRFGRYEEAEGMSQVMREHRAFGAVKKDLASHRIDAVGRDDDVGRDGFPIGQGNGWDQGVLVHSE